jgi:hypothetical protein
VKPDPVLIQEAVDYYQTASYRFQHGLMKKAAGPNAGIGSSQP